MATSSTQNGVQPAITIGSLDVHIVQCVTIVCANLITTVHGWGRALGRCGSPFLRGRLLDPDTAVSIFFPLCDGTPPYLACIFLVFEADYLLVPVEAIA